MVRCALMDLRNQRRRGWVSTSMTRGARRRVEFSAPPVVLKPLDQLNGVVGDAFFVARLDQPSSTLAGASRTNVELTVEEACWYIEGPRVGGGRLQSGVSSG